MYGVFAEAGAVQFSNRARVGIARIGRTDDFAPVSDGVLALEAIAIAETVNPVVIDRAWTELAAEGSRLTAALKGVAVMSRGIER